MQILSFLRLENIFEEVRHEVVYIKMKHLCIRTGEWIDKEGKVHEGNHPSKKRISASDAELFIHNWHSPDDFEKQEEWNYDKMEYTILKYGMKEPLCIRPQFDTGDYEMWDGSHRSATIKYIVLTQYPELDLDEVLVPCIIRNDFEAQAAEYELIKQRQDKFYDSVDFSNFIFRGARAVPDNKLQQFYNKVLDDINIQSDIFGLKTLSQGFCHVFDKYIHNSKLNKLEGLKDFRYKSYINGTSQAFDSFWMRHHDKRFRTFQGEFFYHKANWKKYHDWLPIEKDDIKENDAVIISLPFSDYCKEHPKMRDVLDSCEKLNVPVLIDCAWYLIAKNVEFDFSKYNCIEDVTFSMSKGFHDANKLRAGMRYSRKYHDDNISIMNQWQQYNFISAYISIQMLKTFEPDYAWNKFGEAYKKLVKEHDGWSETDCVGFVHGDERFSELNRGTDINRLCIVDKLGDI
jgi:hypothetical protein